MPEFRVSVGQELGRYRIAEQIGAGGMGVRANDQKLKREVAIPGARMLD